MDDDELALRLARARSGQATPGERRRTLAEIDALFAQCQDRVYAVCLRYVGDRERARELAQDTLLVAYGKLDQYRGDARGFTPWVYGIARHLCMNAVRKRGDLLSEDGVIEATDPARTALSSLRRQERQDLVQQAAAAVLDATEQEAVYLRYVEEMPRERITDVLGLTTASGARGLLQRCQGKLRAEIRRRLAEMGQGTSFLRDTR